MKRSSLTLFLGSCIVAAAMVLASCSEAPPQLLELYWQLNLWNDTGTGKVHEALSVWTHARDEDGVDDIEYIYIIHDKSELFWELTADTWDRMDENGETWLGTNRIFMADLSPLPRGEYRIVMIDKAGDRDEKKIYVPTRSIDAARTKIPDCTVAGENLRIDNPYGSYSLWFYGDGDRILHTYSGRGKNVPLSEAAGSPDILASSTSLILYTYNGDDGYGLFTGPVSLGGN